MLKTAFILFLLLASGCKDQYTPKPYGYFRIDFPEKQWVASPLTSSLQKPLFYNYLINRIL